MPIYEYVCGDCGEKFSLLKSVSASDDKTECTRCKSRKVRKLMSSFCCSSGSGDFSSSGFSGGYGGGGG